jgi:hypothetical protein
LNRDLWLPDADNRVKLLVGSGAVRNIVFTRAVEGEEQVALPEIDAAADDISNAKPWPIRLSDSAACVYSTVVAMITPRFRFPSGRSFQGSLLGAEANANRHTLSVFWSAPQYGNLVVADAMSGQQRAVGSYGDSLCISEWGRLRRVFDFEAIWAALQVAMCIIRIPSAGQTLHFRPRAACGGNKGHG